MISNKTITNFIIDRIRTKIEKLNHSKLKLFLNCIMAYDIIDVAVCKADIITMGSDMIKNLKKFNKSSEEYSLKTTKGFYNDVKSSGFKI